MKVTLSFKKEENSLGIDTYSIYLNGINTKAYFQLFKDAEEVSTIYLSTEWQAVLKTLTTKRKLYNVLIDIIDKDHQIDLTFKKKKTEGSIIYLLMVNNKKIDEMVYDLKGKAQIYLSPWVTKVLGIRERLQSGDFDKAEAFERYVNGNFGYAAEILRKYNRNTTSQVIDDWRKVIETK